VIGGPVQSGKVGSDVTRDPRPAAPCARALYEGNGGWTDGRLGQAYDLIHSALTDREEDAFRHPLLAAIEALDIDFAAQPSA
jgi:hypothetical protein